MKRLSSRVFNLPDFFKAPCHSCYPTKLELLLKKKPLASSPFYFFKCWTTCQNSPCISGSFNNFRDLLEMPIAGQLFCPFTSHSIFWNNRSVSWYIATKSNKLEASDCDPVVYLCMIGHVSFQELIVQWSLLLWFWGLFWGFLLRRYVDCAAGLAGHSCPIPTCSTPVPVTCICPSSPE